MNRDACVGGGSRGRLISAANFHLTTHVGKDVNADVAISCLIRLNYNQFINFSCVYIVIQDLFEYIIKPVMQSCRIGFELSMTSRVFPFVHRRY